MELVVSILVMCLVVWLVFFVLGNIPMPQPLRTVITAVVGILMLIWILHRAGVLD